MGSEELSLAAAIASTVAALGALAAAVASNRVAKAMRTIETDRRRGELTPEFEARVLVSGSGAVIEITLVGPKGLDYLDWVVFQVRDVGPDVWLPRSESVPVEAGGRVGEPVLSRFRFAPDVVNVSNRGRTLRVGVNTATESSGWSTGKTIRCALAGPEIPPEQNLSSLLQIEHDAQHGVAMSIWAYCYRDEYGYGWCVPVDAVDGRQ